MTPDILDDNENAVEYSTVLQDFLTKAKVQETGFMMEIYRVIEDRHSGKLVDKYLWGQKDDIPELDFIGNRFGAGCYRIRVTYTDKNKSRRSKSQIVHIDNSFIKSEPEQISGMTPAGPAAQQQNFPAGSGQSGFSSTDIVTLFQAFMGTISDIIKNQNSQKSESFDMVSFNSAMSKMIVGNFQTQNSLVNDMMRNRVNQSGVVEDEGPDPEPEPNIYDMLKQLILQYGKTLLEGNGGTQSFFKKQVQSSQGYRDLLENPQGYVEAYEKLLGEGTSKTELDKILSILGAPDPGSFVEPETATAE